MPEYEHDGEEAERETDPATIAYLDQAEAQFATDREQFKAIYGFDHDCHCSQDYTDGKMTEVTQCFLKLTAQALNRSAEATYETHVLAGMVEELMRVNNDLIRIMVDNGLKNELEQYVTKTYDLDAEQQEQIQLAFAIESETQDGDDSPEAFEGTLADGLDDADGDES